MIRALLSLEDMTGVLEADAQSGVARVLSGTGLGALGEGLAEHGAATQNLGDVDYQAIARAVATATHGSGNTLWEHSGQPLVDDARRPTG